MSTVELTENARKKQKTNSGIFRKLENITIFREKLFVSGGFDIIYFILVIALLTTGLIMMASASYVWGTFRNNDAYHYIKSQGLVAIVGVAAMLVISKINPQIIKKMAVLISIIGLLLLVLVLFYYKEIPDKPGIKRWMEIPFTSKTFQPSDVGKVAMIIGLAWGLEKGKKFLDTNILAPLLYFGVVAVVSLLVFAESHLSAFVMIFAMGIGMLFLSGMDRRWFILCGILGVIAIIIFFSIRHEILNEYQNARIDSFFVKDYDDTDGRWQTNQSLYALGSGGLFGLGLGNSIQKYMYIPEPHNDFIFAIVGEELGFFRAVLIIILFLALVARGFIIAERTKSMYERLVVLGISLQVGIQSVLNILVVTDMIPNTGISLPFFSFGGTALLILLAEMGLVLGISRTGSRKAKIRDDKMKEDKKDAE
ncbi:MAG: FtsW/RodA/SpoVE family cell cycle protein [Clostridia bacterium]|nr:FtsW/RodA/SpoVE family cell cycle protein [Clostridia bacterium]MBQ7044111.1 FtsW/RodA/SpoVE family cell cycle protein [Clostridia bacterium]